MTTAALGEEASVAAAQELANALGLSWTITGDPAELVAERLARGAIVAVVQGRFEWGPRALGQRSILALPTDASIRERLNVVVKKREPFRPFAPAVLLERAGAYFDGAPNDMTPFMTTTCPVKNPSSLAAVTHVDGSARVQTVTAASAPFLASVLAAVDRRRPVPIVLNTSLNGPGEPIVASAVDALGFFCAHPVDMMVIGDLVVERPA
jgi:carbamoyltransferase